MKKTIAGFTLVFGIFVVFAGILIGEQSKFVEKSVANDWIASLYTWAGIGLGVLGVGMFFFGAMIFARR